MRKQPLWITREGEEVDLNKIDDLYLVNLCKHIIFRIETNLDKMDFYSSSFVPVGQIAREDAQLEVDYATLENATLKTRLDVFKAEAKNRGLEIPEKTHIRKWE